MTLKDKFGRGGTNIRKVSIHDAPDINMLQRLLSDLSVAAPGTECDISWQTGNGVYTLTLSHSRQSARAVWKFHIGGGVQSKPVWDYATNDVSVIHQLITSAVQRPAPTQSKTGLGALRTPSALPEERRTIDIDNNLSRKLRQLFIGAREDLVAAADSSLPNVKPQPIGQSHLAAKPIIEYIDLTPGRNLLQKLFVNQQGIFSYPTFLFFLEREYSEAIENRSPMTLIFLKASTRDSKALSPSVFQELVKRMKHTQRKTDILAQCEPNKFAVLLPDTNSGGGNSFVTRVQKALLKTALAPGLDNTTVKFTFGLATLGEHCSTLATLLSFAEDSLEKAQELGKDVVSHGEIVSEIGASKQYLDKSADLGSSQQLVTQLVSGGIFTYPAFVAFLEHEYYRCVRKKKELLIMLLKVRVDAETFDEPTNLLPASAFFEVIRRVNLLLTKRDVFAHFGHNNFVIMRPTTSYTQMQSFAKRAVQSLMSDDWLTPECRSNSLRIHTQICTISAHPTESNLLGLVAVE